MMMRRTVLLQAILLLLVSYVEVDAASGWREKIQEGIESFRQDILSAQLKSQKDLKDEVGHSEKAINEIVEKLASLASKQTRSDQALHTTINSLKDSLLEVISESASDHVKIKELKDKLVKIGPVIQSNTADLDVLRRGVNGTKLDLRVDVHQLKTIINSTNQKLESMATKQASSDVAMQTTIKALGGALKNISIDATTSKGAIKGLTNELQSLKSTKNELELVKTHQIKIDSVLQDEVANLKSRINSNAAKLTSYQSALKEAQHLKTEVFQLKNKLGESLGQLSAIQSKNGDLTTEVQTLKARLSKIDGEPIGVTVASTCEKNWLKIVCPSGQSINIKGAMYGRDNKDLTCGGPIRNIKCKSMVSLSVVKSRCQSQKTCSMPATNHVFGDPCPGTKKFLRVAYDCVRTRM